MATPDAMLRRPKRFHRVVACLVLLCLAWLLFDALHQLSFVQVFGCSGHMAIQRQVTRRLGQKGQQTSGEQDVADHKATVKKLTSGMKKARSAKELTDVLGEAMGGPIFDFIHASAAYTQLVTLNRRRRLQRTDWESPVLLRLHAQVEDMILQDQLNAQASANVLWSLGQLLEWFSIPSQLLIALGKSLPCKAKGMKAQELSNCLWASAQLKDVAPEVLEAMPAIITCIPNKVHDMIPQHLSNCLFASAQLKDEVPKVLEIVPAIVGEIQLNSNGMVPQALSNSLEALVLLRDSVPEVAGFLAGEGNFDDILRSAATRLNTLLPRLFGKDFGFAVPVVVWACARAGVYDGELLDSVARRLGSRNKLSALPNFGVCALSWSYQVLDTEDDFEGFKTLLMSETEKRRFSEADVKSCQRGRSGWNYR